MVGVAGCVAQAEGEEIVTRASRPSTSSSARRAYHRLPDLIAARRSPPRRVVDTEYAGRGQVQERSAGSIRAARTRSRGLTAFLTVQEGCDKFCTFCVVPYTRGAEVSRPVAQMRRRKPRSWPRPGVREVTLLGQNVNAYHGVGPDGAEWTLARLLRRLAEVPGIARLRYTTSHPREHGPTTSIAAHRDLPELMPYLHLPVQSGSSAVLKRMNRKHTRDDYFRLVDRIRAARPDIALTSDFIVGFPGETDADFADDAGSRPPRRLRDRLYLRLFAAARHTGGRDATASARRAAEDQAPA